MGRRLSLGLAAMVLVAIAARKGAAQEDARKGAAQENSRAVTQRRLSRAATEVRSYRDSVGELPGSREGIDGVVSDPKSLVDAWGRPVIYIRVAGGFWLVSWGADGAPGGTGDAADVVEISR